ncbi:pyridoxamine 5'-phosphate oxidase [Virgisporangium aliadipatigenens]|nr:pyridoxamine 5'-phosphate oxidase [Virgisporangium aliadipatigenens]
MRHEYSGTLTEDDIAADWPTQFGAWFDDAVSAGVSEPNAMVLATADAAGRPSARTVLMKDYDERGFVFYTNHDSRKGRQLAQNPFAALTFPWYPLHRQVHAAGSVAPVTRAETEEYFALRPRGAQLGAWASTQSSVLPSRAALEESLAAVEERFPDEVPAPPHWGGYRLTPETVEFWQGRRDRLHDRLRFRASDGGWVIERLAP